MMRLLILYVGTSLTAALRRAEREINDEYRLDLRLDAHNCGEPLTAKEGDEVREGLRQADIVFIIHVTEAENVALISAALREDERKDRPIIVINCLGELMRLGRLGRLEFSRRNGEERKDGGPGSALKGFIDRLGTWMSAPKGNGRAGKSRRVAHHDQYLKLIAQIPSLLKYVPAAGRLRDLKNYLQIFAYFVQPTPANIKMMLLYAIRHYVPGAPAAIECAKPEIAPTVAIYHPDAPGLEESYQAYREWYQRAKGRALDPESTIGLLLMRPAVIGGAHRHYEGAIRALEDEGLAVIPALATFMDQREACRRFFVAEGEEGKALVSQVVSLTGFSFVGGPASHDSEAAIEFLRELNVPFHAAISLDLQTIEQWEANRIGLNPMQTGMQVAIPELDGATEPLVFGGMSASAEGPQPIDERCRRLARRVRRWNHLRTSARGDLRLAFLVFCFPPNKGDLGTAAELDVFPSLWGILRRLAAEGYEVEVPASADDLREMLLGGNADRYGTHARVGARMDLDQYRRLCPYVEEAEAEWGPAPGEINVFGRELLIHGVQLGQAFIGVQPTFGYEGDPMRLLMAEGGAPHHGFLALYTWLERVFQADAVIHVGTHGALEFMPGKQVGLSARCWPDRLIGELPHIYLYSVNNPSEGTIAKRRSAAELISYLTPPVESAGLYRELAGLKETLEAYRAARDEGQRARLYASIEAQAAALHLTLESAP